MVSCLYLSSRNQILQGSSNLLVVILLLLQVQKTVANGGNSAVTRLKVRPSPHFNVKPVVKFHGISLILSFQDEWQMNSQTFLTRLGGKYTQYGPITNGSVRARVHCRTVLCVGSTGTVINMQIFLH